MKHGKKAMLAAGLLAGAAAMTGCTANTTPAATPSPKATAAVTVMPQETMESPAESPDTEESPGPIALTAEGKTLERAAVREGKKMYLPLVETAEALGWKAETEDGEKKRTITLEKEESKISVSFLPEENKQVSWQRDGLLIPVDPDILTKEDGVYVPAAFFEEAMDAVIREKENAVEVTLPEPKYTPENQGT